MSTDEAILVKQARQGTVQTAVRLPVELMDRLRGDGRNVSEEIRRRLELAFAIEAFDPQTRELASNIRQLAVDVHSHTGLAWHAHPKSRETMVAAIVTWLEAHHVPAVIEGKDPWNAGDPPTLGRAIARARMIALTHEVLVEVETSFGTLDDEEIERRRQLSIKAHQPAAEWVNELCREITKAIEERKAAAPEEDATEKALRAIKRALSIEPDRSTAAAGEQPADKRANQRKGKGKAS